MYLTKEQEQMLAGEQGEVLERMFRLLMRLGEIYGADRMVGCDLPQRNYEKVIEALGGHGELVTEPSEIAPAIERAIESDKPACVNILTDPRISPRKLGG